MRRRRKQKRSWLTRQVAAVLAGRINYVRIGAIIILAMWPFGCLIAFTGGTIFDPFPGKGLPPHSGGLTPWEYWSCVIPWVLAELLIGIAGLKYKR